MTYKEIVDLIKLINKSELTEFKIKDGEFELSIRTNKYSKFKGDPNYIPPAQHGMSIPQSPMMPQQQYLTPEGINPQTTEIKPDSKAVAAAEETIKLVEVKSPMVGTFYRAPSPDKPPYLKVGDVIDVGTVVCIVEAMKLFNEIESEVSGKVVKVMIEDASPVEYDQVLFLVDPNG